MKRRSHQFDLIVIGSGAGGGVGASYAASLGKKVALFEGEAIGGECPNYACVPTKALLQAAEVYETVKQAGRFGIKTGRVSLDYGAVRAWKDLVVSRTGAGAEGAKAFTEEGITVVREKAHFTSPREVEAGGKRYEARRFLIATGTTVAVPPIPGLESSGYLTFREAINLPAPPRSIFILGGGPIGCEFGQLFSTFGSEVHISDIASRLLIREDLEVGELVGAIFENRSIRVHAETTVTSVGKVRDGRKVVHFEAKGKAHHVTVDEVLVATGKKPVTQIGLEAAQVRYDKGGIRVNRALQTSAPHIFAAGDVVGPYLFTHTAAYQSYIAAHNAFHRKMIRADYGVVPRCTFIIPEVASVGISEEEARERRIRHRIGISPISVIGRANTSDEFNGFVKVVTDRRGVIIGASIVAPRAGEMIHELALAMKLRATASEVAATIHAFPTFSEAIKIACSELS